MWSRIDVYVKVNYNLYEMKYNPNVTVEVLNKRAHGHFPAYMGIVTESVEQGVLRMSMQIRNEFIAPNTFLHAGTIVTLADTACGFACMAHLPEGATGFTTIELKTNFLATARSGTMVCEARAVHMGRTTHVWDATVKHLETDRIMAVFRCTQIILHSK